MTTSGKTTRLGPFIPFFQHYQPLLSCYDEAFAATDAPRDCWRRLITHLDGLGSMEFGQRWEQTSRLLQEHGISHIGHEDPAKKWIRPLQVDPLPLLIPADEWQFLERALQQRFLVWDLLIQDLYGPQRLVKEGVLPTFLVQGNPRFLRSCHGLRSSATRLQRLSATDLFRSPQGIWTVFNDRTQAPTGLGTALENRMFISQMLIDGFHEQSVMPLSRFCSSLQEALAETAFRNRDNPRIVLLTAGSAGATYAEDAFLARYMGYPLVESGDLTVRQNTVCLKSLSGLHQVDVVFRRLNDRQCDPLAIRSDAMLGVPGLVETIRSQRSALANALGCGIAQTPGYIPFFPALSRFFLGEDPLLPSLPTWWLGDRDSLKMIQARFATVVIKRVFQQTPGFPILVRELDVAAQTKLWQRIERNPEGYLAQEEPVFATAPAWNDGIITPEHVILRTFAVPHGDEVVVMPGGLARTTRSLEHFIKTLKVEGGSKDVWIQGKSAPSSATMLRSPLSDIVLSRGGKDLQSRVADNFFWLGRYLERVENIFRLLRCVFSRLTEEHEFVSEPELTALLNLLAKKGLVPADLVFCQPSEALPELRREFQFTIFQDKTSSSVAGMVADVRRVALLVRDRLASDTWRILRRLETYLVVPSFKKQLKMSEMLDLINEMILTLSAFNGLAMENITRSHDWRFLDLGKRLERALQVVELLQGTVLEESSNERAVLEAVLEAADSSMTYRSRYRASLQAFAVVDLLLTDEINPRSVAFQAVAMHHHIENLPREPFMAGLSPEQKLILKILSALRLADVRSLCETTREGSRPKLAELIGKLERKLPALSDLISQQYFIHVQTSQHLSLLQPEGQP
jgi:uncharacterized circularly permuted ATP-grasp superfamily protein/uncharacterized alpha-E superfamily protein